MVVFDITNPYNVTVLDTVEVASRSGLIDAVPGQPLAVVGGISAFYGGVAADAAVDVIDFSDPENAEVLDTGLRSSTFAMGFAVLPGEDIALISDAANNELIFIDISDPGDINEMTDISPLWFPGTGGIRIGVSPDGQYAVLTNNVGHTAVIFDFSDMAAPTAMPLAPSMPWEWPFDVAFRP